MKRKKVAVWAAGILAAAVLSQGSFAREEAWDFSYEDAQDLCFVFSSGVGGWSTHLFLGPDGEFWGCYSDSDMGTSGEGYPYGTVYRSDFYGYLGEPEKVDDYTYRVSLQYLDTLNQTGEERIRDGIRYVYTGPYGVEETESFLVYLPGKPLSDLPEEYYSWVRMALWDEEEALPFYGLYNEDREEGFSSYPLIPAAEYWDGVLSETKEEARPLEWSLNHDSLPQQSMNQLQAELYTLWDDLLNDIWGHLRESLSQEQMDALTREELDWIEDKEASVAREGAMVEGGSMQPLVEYGKATAWTKQRVYELMMYFGDV